MGILDVPSHFKESQHQYGEGVVTMLSYHDSSLIELQFGGDIRLPLLSGPEYILDSTAVQKGRHIRFGHMENSKRAWQEDAMVHMMNITFFNVRRNMIGLYEKALSSFVP